MLKSLIKASIVLAAIFLPVVTAGAASVRIYNEELVTLSDSEAIIYFSTSDTAAVSVEYSTDPDNLDETAQTDLGNDLYHLIKLDGLRPDTTYYYRTVAGDQTGQPNDYSPGTFTTLTPPGGKYLFSFATITDLHFGYHVSGIIGVGGDEINEGVAWPDDENPFWRFTNRAAVERINDQPQVAFTVVKGDLTIDYRQQEFEWAHEVLQHLQNPFYVLRGNHDRVGENPADYFLEEFSLDRSYFSFDYGGFHFVALDSSDLETGMGIIDEQQMQWLANDLSSASEMPTFVFMHHAAAPEATPAFTILEPTPNEFVDFIAAHDNVIGVFSGHSHRNYKSSDERTGDLPWSETASTKDYPGMWTLYRVYDNGYMAVSYRINCDDCLLWYEMTRQMYDGQAQALLLGSLEDRNYVYRFAEPKKQDKQTNDSGCSSIGSQPDATGVLAVAAFVVYFFIAIRKRRNVARVPD